MINAIYYNYGPEPADLIIDGLERTGKYKFPIWIDNVNHFEHVCDVEQRKPLRIPDYSFFLLREGDVGSYEYVKMEKGLKEKIFNKYFRRYCLQASRHDLKAHTNVHLYRDRTPHANLSIYAQQNIFYILMNFYYQLIKKYDITLIYFNAIIHEGADVVLYALAKELNVRTVVTHKFIPWPDKFICVESVDNFGDFSKLPSLHEVKPYTKAVGEKPKAAYKLPEYPNLVTFHPIDEYIQYTYLGIPPKKTFTLLRRSLKRCFVQFYSQFKGIILNRPYSRTPPQYNIPALIWQLNHITDYLNYQRYMENSISQQQNLADLESNFVFFPLHYQPESTTLAIGKQFYDQILAIEVISDLIPDDWNIYIKDHYRVQREIMRDESFWVRLKGIKKAKLLSQKVNTFELIEYAQFTATVTGTAGFESLLAGKTTLIFGEAWYSQFSGAVNYHSDIILDDILKCKVDLAKLSYDIGMFESKLYEGCNDSNMVKYTEQYDFNKNIIKRVESLDKVFSSKIT